jgi:hypothetical protein
MNFYLCLVNESGDLIVEQSSEVGFHSEEVGLESGGFPDVSNNPNTADKPRGIQPFPCVL